MHNTRKLSNLSATLIFYAEKIKAAKKDDDIQEELRGFFQRREELQMELDRMVKEVAMSVPIPEKIDAYCVTPEIVIHLAVKKGLNTLYHDGVLTFTDAHLLNCVVQQFMAAPAATLLEAAEWLLAQDNV